MVPDSCSLACPGDLVQLPVLHLPQVIIHIHLL